MQFDHFLSKIDLMGTLQSGQFFRWTRDEDHLFIHHGADRWSLGLADHTWQLLEGDAIRLAHFLSLEHDPFASVRVREDVPEVIREAAPNIRIIQQSAYEALVAFLLSSNNHQHRIRQMLRVLTQPDIGTLMSPKEILQNFRAEDLVHAKFGYRAPWVISMAQHLCNHPNWLEHVKQLPTSSAQSELCKLDGIGPKVAQCILLFGFLRTDVYPTDVWIERGTRLYFPYTRKLSDAKLQGWALRKFGTDAGLVQQLIYAHMTKEAGRMLR